MDQIFFLLNTLEGIDLRGANQKSLGVGKRPSKILLSLSPESFFEDFLRLCCYLRTYTVPGIHCLRIRKTDYFPDYIENGIPVTLPVFIFDDVLPDSLDHFNPYFQG